MKAVYDLSRYPANFNFIEFLVAASTLGADHIFFDDTKGYRAKYSKAEICRRVDSILEPACALAGCTYSFGKGSGIDPGYHMNVVLDVYEDMGRIKKLKSVLPPKDVEYTVTLRNSKRYPERNSDESSWRRFADEIGALVIPDYSDSEIHLHERMALYAGAKMNFFVGNGPMYLCLFSEYPFKVFMKNVNFEYHKRIGWPEGGQLPWFNTKQRAVWSEDSYEEIRRVWST